MLSDHCPVLSVCLSPVLKVCDVGVSWPSQTVGWIKMKLGMGVDLGPGNIVLDVFFFFFLLFFLP